MFKLNKHDFSLVAPLFRKHADTVPTFAEAVADGYIEGHIYVNDRTDVKAAVIETGGYKYYICGIPYEAFVQSFIKLYEEKNSNKVKIFSGSPEWDVYIEQTGNKGMKKTERTWFAFNKSRFTQLSDGFQADASSNPFNEESIFLCEKCAASYDQRVWADGAPFLHHGLGICAKKDKRVIAECASIYRSNSKAEIDIYTDEDFRGRGLAFHVAKRFIEKCLDLGLIPTWDCDTENEASMNLADKLGFDPGKVYRLYEFEPGQTGISLTRLDKG
jgi:RimJ/RimL family protein N-acetyltransferase